MKERKSLFTVREKVEYFLKLGGLYNEARDVETQLIMVKQGRFEETAVSKRNKLKKEWTEEIGRRKSIIGNG